MRAVQAGDVSYKEQSAASAARARVEIDGVSAEKSVAAARVSVRKIKFHKKKETKKLSQTFFLYLIFLIYHTCIFYFSN